MKNRFFILFISAALMLSLFSCGIETGNLESDATEATDTEEERVIIQQYGMDLSGDSTASLIADCDNLEAVTELATNIVKCKIVSLDKIDVLETNEFGFKYTVEIIDTYLNVNIILNAGDKITVSTLNGLLKASDAAKAVKGNAHFEKFGILQGEYKDNEYITSSVNNAAPIEVGKTYIMFLTDRYLENGSIYSDVGRSYVFNIDGDKVYSGKNISLDERSTNALIDEIKGQIAKRTGRADEVGSAQYIEELGKKQAEQNKQ